MTYVNRILVCFRMFRAFGMSKLWVELHAVRRKVSTNMFGFFMFVDKREYNICDFCDIKSYTALDHTRVGYGLKWYSLNE